MITLCKRSYLIGAFFLMMSLQGMAQRHEQFWMDYQLSYPFANKYLVEGTATYQTVLSKENKWHSFAINPSFEYTLFHHVDLIGEMTFAYTLQVDSVNTAGFDPSLGARFHITQNRRINLRVIGKMEQRFFHQIEAMEWEKSNRFRLKAEAFIAINRPNLFMDKLWYAIIDYEEFFVTDQQLDERFANRRRARIGLGYRWNYKNRFELIYTRQTSRNEIQGGFISDDNVIQLRYKMYLNPARPPGTTP